MYIIILFTFSQMPSIIHHTKVFSIWVVHTAERGSQSKVSSTHFSWRLYSNDDGDDIPCNHHGKKNNKIWHKNVKSQKFISAASDIGFFSKFISTILFFHHFYNINVRPWHFTVIKTKNSEILLFSDFVTVNSHGLTVM